jgi:hypothetical protein
MIFTFIKPVIGFKDFPFLITSISQEINLYTKLESSVPPIIT